MGTKSAQNNNKSSWLLGWFSQMTTPRQSSSPRQPSSKKNSGLILPWKKDTIKASPTSSVVTEACECESSYGNATLKKRKKKQQMVYQAQHQHRPSITISLSPSTGRRNSQQTTHSSINTSDDQNSYCRRDSSSDRSILSELWTKAKQRHPHYPRFHWPNKTNKDETQQQQQQQYYQLRPSNNDCYYDSSSLPSSFRQTHFFPKHLKRYSVSSSIHDHTPAGSRPNSIIYTSQPGSPNFAALLMNNDVDSYWLDETPKLKWEIKHELTKLAMEGLYSIPELVTQQTTIEKQVLQIGCGDAAWGIEVASCNSRWMVIGLDETEEHYYSSNSPKNFKFVKCNDLLQGLKRFPDDSFDIISCRFLIMGYTFQQYQDIITESIRITKSTGFIEVLEMDLRIYYDRLSSCSITQLLNTEVIKAIESKELDPRLARHLPDLIIDTDIQSESRYISLPLGLWGGKLGVMFRDDVHTLIETFQSDIAEQKGKSCRTEGELEYKTDVMDMELDSNRAFMNLHLMVIHIK
ncbi:hypothetical protein BDF21DRAFT_362318 [Thamnidium elegans]|nr:hypothetical protein BDF21DRAFT_362318 [Thamnidium elegans]